jgi:hypothetical protein
MSQESTHTHVSPDVTRAFTTPSSQNTAECYSSSSTLVTSRGGLLIGELAGWQESSSMVNKRKAGATSNMSSQAQNGRVESAQNGPLSTTSLRNVVVVPSAADSDTNNISVEGKRPLPLGVNGHPQVVRSSSSAVSAKPLSRATTKIPRSPLLSRDTYNHLNKVEGASRSSKAFIATSYPYSRSQSWHDAFSRKG